MGIWCDPGSLSSPPYGTRTESPGRYPRVALRFTQGKSSDGTMYARVQILSIHEILEGKQPEYPLHRRDATFKEAPRSRPCGGGEFDSSVVGGG